MSRLSQNRIDTSLLPSNDLAELLSLSNELQTSNRHNLNLSHSRAKVLFTEGETARGVYILRTGRATVSISSSGGKVVVLRVARTGDVLGLNSTLRNCPYDVTVQTLEPCRTDFISRAELVDLMRKSHRNTQVVLTTLSRELAELGDRAKSLLLSQTSRSRLAKLLLEWSNGSPANGSSTVRIDRYFTQEEIAQMIGASRETVTRLLATFSRRNIIEITADSILIHNWAALETAAEDK